MLLGRPDKELKVTGLVGCVYMDAALFPFSCRIFYNNMHLSVLKVHKFFVTLQILSWN